MNLRHSPLPLPWAVLGWILLAPLALHSLHRARSGATLHSAQQHLWLAGVVLLAWLWTLQARAVEGAAFGLLGAAFYALIFGCEIRKMEEALSGFVIRGVDTTIPFHQRILEISDYREGKINTKWIEETFWPQIPTK